MPEDRRRLKNGGEQPLHPLIYFGLAYGCSRFLNIFPCTNGGMRSLFIASYGSIGLKLLEASILPLDVHCARGHTSGKNYYIMALSCNIIYKNSYPFYLYTVYFQQ